ncbi:MAG TPA: anthranilate phosphoribosyltransferase [Kiritimatiellia bacterium]|nr:anthranilate phosphoribosyltransferase [Kiritimatiellia bacterium]HNS80105.1 anthranilate phosphoribosyltransferase [Kiritimatiellia bacterium]HPA77413.1 anthranilate phosphoribosyltransferase [Kiritimatiellia bacterium]HQQ03520.1 anthranilate phosphoribosyltransferase [Kiritimatiellia bacterium]
MIKETIAKLVDGKELTRQESYETLKEIMSGNATPAQIGSFITALRIRGESADVIAGGVQAMREKLIAIATPEGNVVDIVGTGGDQQHTFNISTTAAFVVAGAGVMVAKHGNRRVSSSCGAADVLTELGVNIEIGPPQMEKCIREAGIAFLFAPALHPAMKYASAPRSEVGIRSIFNILGPLSNPTGARRGVLGVYTRDLVKLFSGALAQLGSVHMFVAHGLDGLDEITTTGKTAMGEVRGGDIRLFELDPRDYGIPLTDSASLRGGDSAANALLVKEVLSGKTGPKRDIVLLNAAVTIMAGGGAETIEAGLTAAAKSIDSWAAMEKLEKLVALTNEK